MSLTPDESARYSRQMVMSEVGPEGQARLKRARVLLVGAGGLGSPAALYLAAAGVGKLGVIDFDEVESSNLHRQVLYGESDLGRPKAVAAAERLAEMNPHIEVEGLAVRLEADNVQQTIADYDVVVDGSDNFQTRYLVNDACIAAGRPIVFGSVLRFEGQVSVFGVEDGPCYRCLHPEPPPVGMLPNCAEGGVLGALPGIVGSLQSLEAIKLILGAGRPLVGRLLVCEGLDLRFREIAVPKDPECATCGRERSPEASAMADEGDLAGREADPVDVPFDISPVEVQSWRDSGRTFQFVDVRLPREYDIARIDGTSLLPLHELPARFEELDREQPMVVICHHGIRSAQAVAFLRGQGFAGARNLTGGMAVWSREIDPSIPQY